MLNKKMEWKDLLSGVRLRKMEVKSRTMNNKYDLRNDFEDDYGRLIFSSAVRRLQDKTQVFPLEKSDFVRTRLTHSHEVSTIGRSIGVSVEENLIKTNQLSKDYRGEISTLLAVIGLVHDLGNPPYGHYGESAIQNFFKNWFDTKDGKVVAKELGEEKVADFENFEGNAQTFRLLTQLHNLKDDFGYDLSAASLASIIKYPRSSIEGNKDSTYRAKYNLGVSYKKFGYLQSEAERFAKVKEITKIGKYRHPITFLLEAADDIAYLAADLEDGCKKNILDYQTIVDVLEKYLNNENEEEKRIISTFKEAYRDNRNEKYTHPLDNSVQILRIHAQGYMIKSVVKEFLNRSNDILSGNFDDEILKVSDAKNVNQAFGELGGRIFSDKNIISLELSGGKVIQGLLELFVKAVLSEECNTNGSEENKIYSLISDGYKDIMYKTASKRNINKKPNSYDKLLLVTDFVCGMTDSYALEIYRRLNGIKL